MLHQHTHRLAHKQRQHEMRGRTRGVCLLFFLLSISSCPQAAAAIWPQQQQPQHSSQVTRVHVVWANHLDVGFTGWDNETLNAYFHSHIPRALWLADWAARAQPPERFVWTSHPWLLSLYLDCPSHIGVVCPSPAQQQAVRAAMRAGTITWHAAPFNLDWELLPGPVRQQQQQRQVQQQGRHRAHTAHDGGGSSSWWRRALRVAGAAASHSAGVGVSSSSSHGGSGHGLFWSALEMSRQLDRQLQVPHKTVVSLRDVPGLTRAAIPMLAAEGIRVLTVGVNAGSAPPDVPLDTPFIWRDPPSNSSLIAIWHAGGYGGSCRDDTAPPGSPELQVACAQQCVRVEGLGDMMCLSWRADNQGPPQDSLEVVSVMNLVRRQWIHSNDSSSSVVVATSTLQAWSDRLLAVVDGGRVKLQVVEAEIGDTWVYGVASDPLKIANYKAAARARQACAADSSCDARSPAVSRFDRLLLKVPEHTWGLDVKTTLENFDCCGTYSNEHLHACMRGQEPPQAAVTVEGSTVANPQQQQQRQRMLSSVGDVSSSPPDPPGCGGMTRLVTSWQRQAAYVDWALQELPCGHPILTAYQSDLRQRLALAAAATNPQGTPLLRTHEQHVGADNPTAASPSVHNSQPPAGATLGSSSSSGVGSGDNDLVFRGSSWVVGVDKATGAITTLCSTTAPPQHSTAQHTVSRHSAQTDPCVGSHNWAATGSHGSSSRSSLFASPLYVVFRDGDYDTVWNEYAWEGPPHTNPWFRKDLSHPGLNSSWDKHVEAEAQLEEVYVDDSSHSSSEAGGDTLLSLQLHYSLPAWLHKSAGAPSRLVLLISETIAPPAPTSPAADSAHTTTTTTPPPAAPHTLQLSLVWVNKSATRIPEATWLRFALDPHAAVDPHSWRLHKMGSALDPLEVMRNGSYSMHAVDDVTGVTVASPPPTVATAATTTLQQQSQQQRELTITPLDSPLVSPGQPLMLPNVRHPPDLAGHGVGFALHNNLWGTNFVQWLPYSTHSSSGVSDGQRASDSSCDGRSSRLRGGWWQRCHCGGDSEEQQHGGGASASSSNSSNSSSMLQWLQRVLVRLRRALWLDSAVSQAHHQQQRPGSSLSSAAAAAAADSSGASAALEAAVADQRVAVFRFQITEQLLVENEGQRADAR